MEFAYRTVFLSDLHLGFRGVRTDELSAFLKHMRCERIYLVGDVIDLMSLRQRWHWPVSHNQIVRRILKHAKRGAHVVYIPGNHDDALRQYAGVDFGGVRVALQAIHRTADGRSLLVTHGDEYDLVVQNSRLLALLGTWAYDHLIALNRIADWMRGLVGLPRWSFSQAIKLKVKGACKYVSNFEDALAADARRRNLDGVVCGHVHKPALREDGFVYANCGDFVERASALVEHHDGRLEIIDIEALLKSSGIDTAPSVVEPIDLENPDEDPAVLAALGLPVPTRLDLAMGVRA